MASSDHENETQPNDAAAPTRSSVESQDVNPREAESPDVAPQHPEPNPAGSDTVEPREPIEWLRGIPWIVLGAVPVLLLMGSTKRWELSVPIGSLGCLLMLVGVFTLLRNFRATAATAESVELRALLPSLASLGLGSAALVVVLRLCVTGILPMPVLSAALLVPAVFLWVVVAAFATLRKMGVFEQAVPITRHYGFWLALLYALLYLPMLGSFSLSDPWETHYGEVAREMLARDDWISLWWAQDGWFWSKPVLDFWMQGLGFSLFGVGFGPDQMISDIARGAFPQPEWAARFPVFSITFVGAYVLYKGVAHCFGNRAAFVGGLVLLGMPYWYFLAHQTMTDMPYVAPLCASVGFLLFALNTAPDERVKSYTITIGSRRIQIDAFHLLFTLIGLVVLPQILYLLSRNFTLELGDSVGFGVHGDRFFSGSGGGNCGLPGNQECRRMGPVNPNIQPVHSAVIWSVVFGALLWINRGERRKQRLYFIAAWFAMTLSAMAKGAPGLILPVFIAGVFVGATGRWKELKNAESASLVLVLAAVVLPWYVQMLMRHGHPFIDRLLMHDMYKRAFVHVHDTNAGDDVSFSYYVWQLGYGLFPWTGIAAGGLLWWQRREALGGEDEAARRRRYGSLMLGLWFVGAFSMFTITLTKFHHYIFPLVPALGMLSGIVLDHSLGKNWKGGWRAVVYGFVGLAAAALLTYGATLLFTGTPTGVVPEGGKLSPATPWLGLGLMLGAVACGGIGAWLLKQAPARAESTWDRAALGLIGMASAVVVALCGRDLFTSKSGDIEGQLRLLHLFTYQYKRPWPDSLDFEGTLMAFTLVAALCCGALMFERIRPHATTLLCGVSLLWCAWGLNVYMVKTAPHWGQRETIAAYYLDRASPEQQLVAYQMNWKGENFYTGNRIAAFVQTGKKFKDWLDERRKKGVKVLYFTTEHSRVGSLKSELGKVKSFETLTTKELNNKFVLAKVKL